MYTYEWNTAGQAVADDYQVEVTLTDGVNTDTDGLSATPDVKIILASTLSPIETYSTSLSRIDGFTWVGSEFWAIEDIIYPDTLERIDLTTGNSTKTCTAAINLGGTNSNAEGLTSDGSSIWAANNYSGEDITRHDPSTCAVTARFPAPGTSPRSLAWDGTNLWHGDSDYDRLYKLSTSGTVLAEFPAPGVGPQGMAWDGSHLWIRDITYNGLYQINTTTGLPEDYRALSVSVMEMDWDGANFYGRPVSSDTQIVKLGIKPELSVAELDVTDDLIAEGLPTTITATVYAYDQTSTDIELRFYDGDPDSGGSPLEPPCIIASIAPTTPVFCPFTWSTLSPGEYQIHARVDPNDLIDESNESNNTVSVTIGVYDTDLEAPVIDPILILEWNGDGDGVLEDNEEVRFTWTATDETGIATTLLTIDGSDYIGAPIGGDDFETTVGPLAAAVYEYTVSATDSDNTQETSVVSGSVKIEVHAPDVGDTDPKPGDTDVKKRVDLTAWFDAEMALEEGGLIIDSMELEDADGNTLLGLMDYEPESQGLLLTNYTAMKPGATYTATVPKATSVTDEIGNEVEAEVQWTFTIEADTSPPTLDISSPTDGSTVSGLLDVSGTISDETLESYILEIGEGVSPSSWIELASGGYVEMVGDTIALWDTTTQSNGLHTIRLVAIDEFSHTVQDAITVTILNGVKSPAILYINPSEGLEGIETEVESMGTNFSNSASVLFDLVPAVDVVWVSNTQLNAKVPGVLVPGLYDVTVDNGGGATATLPDGFSVIADTSMEIYLPLILRDAG